jgi:hypothetical protein
MQKIRWHFVFLYVVAFIYASIAIWYFYAFGPIMTHVLKNKLQRSKQRIVISLTTTPHRINAIKPTLDSLRDQSIKADKIYLNVPYEFKRDNVKYVIPQWLLEYPEVTITRTEDFGPITKIVPTLWQEPELNTLIISVDDDIIYPKHLVRELASYAAEHPEAVITPMNVLYHFNDAHIIQKVQFAYEQGSEAAVVLGTSGAAYRRSFFDENFATLIAELPPACVLADDLVISLHLAYSKIKIEQTIQRIFNPFVAHFSYKLQNYGLAADALSYSDGVYLGNHKSYAACLTQLGQSKYQAYQQAFTSRNKTILSRSILHTNEYEIAQ